MIGRIDRGHPCPRDRHGQRRRLPQPPYPLRSTPTPCPSTPPASACSTPWARPSPRAATSTRPPPKNPSPSSGRPPPSASGSTGSSPVSGSGLDNMWFYVAGILKPAVLAPDIDSSVLVGFPAAEHYLGFDGHPSTIYVRAQTGQVNAVDNLLGATANPREPQRGRRLPTLGRPGRPSRRPRRLRRPLLGPRRRRAPRRGGRGGQHHDHLGPRTTLRDRAAPRPRRHQGPHPHPVPRRSGIARASRWRGRRRQSGALATAIYASTKHELVVIPALAWAGGFGAAIIIGAVAGLLPALRAARMSPTQALWSM